MNNNSVTYDIEQFEIELLFKKASLHWLSLGDSAVQNY